MSPPLRANSVEGKYADASIQKDVLHEGLPVLCMLRCIAFWQSVTRNRVQIAAEYAGQLCHC